MVYRVLGKLLWKGELDRAEVVILHRGMPGDRRIVPGSRISSVKKGYILVRDGRGEESTIPLHRILEVSLDEKQIWKRTGKA